MAAEARQVDIVMLREAIARTLGMPIGRLQGFILITVDSGDMTGLVHSAPDIETACEVASQVFDSIPHGHRHCHPR